MRKIHFRCIYTQSECEHINTSGMGKMVECDKCKRYKNSKKKNSKS